VRAVGTHDAGVYAATSRVMAAAVTPVLAMLLASQPRLFRHSHEPTREGHRLIYLILMLALAWGTASGVMLALCSPLLPRLFGESFAGTAKLMPWLAAVAPFLSLRLAAGTILVARGRPSERIGFELCGVLALIVSMLVLTPHYGIRGLAMALVIAELSMTVIGWWLVRLHMGLSAKTL
jgi:O-antigen/teichoic acid export membrane protein